MKIGGLQKFSLSDFPGRISSIVFTQGCNFNCPFCHNGDLIPSTALEGKLIPEEHVLGFLRSRMGRLNGVVISGGEPTIQPDLPVFLRKIRLMGYAIKLDTNGSRPRVIRYLLEKNLVDYIAMDVKAPPGAYDRLSGVKTPVSNIMETINILASSGIDHEFRTTKVSRLLSESDMVSLARLIPPGSKHTFQTFRASNALDPSLAPSATSDTPP